MKFHRIAAFTLIALLVIVQSASARPGDASKQQDFFKSMQESVGHGSGTNTGQPREVSNTAAILLAAGGAGVMVLLVVLSKRQQRPAKRPASLNSPAKLTREILREVPLKSSEMKQLKTLAESMTQQLGEAPDPMTMLLCPSLLARGLKAAPQRIDRKLLAQIVRKMKLSEINQPVQPPSA